jgi:hypothetical protein
MLKRFQFIVTKWVGGKIKGWKFVGAYPLSEAHTTLGLIRFHRINSDRNE